jgi:hypothetical protein
LINFQVPPGGQETVTYCFKMAIAAGEGSPAAIALVSMVEIG